MISPAERQERLSAMEDVIGTQRAEGIHVGPELREMMQRYAEGQLTLEEMSVAMDEYAGRLRRTELASVA